jgi:hypothetical protein
MSRRRPEAHFVGCSVKVPVSVCLGCGKRMDGATAIDHRKAPAPGNITICIGCGHIMAFGDDMRLRALTDAEMIEIAGDPRVVAVQRARRDAELLRKFSPAPGAAKEGRRELLR